MAYWAAARFQSKHERLALHFLGLAGYVVYAPRLREQRVIRGRKSEHRPLLFPGYAFVAIEAQWYGAHRAPGTLGLVMSGDGAPSRVPDTVVDGLRAREHGGLIELPQPRGLSAGDPVRIVLGPFAGQLGLYAGMRPRDRVAVLLQLFGSAQRVELPRAGVELVAGTE